LNRLQRELVESLL